MFYLSTVLNIIYAHRIYIFVIFIFHGFYFALPDRYLSKIDFRSLNGEELFNKINMVKIRDCLKEASQTTSIFLSLDQLRTVQRRFLITGTGIEDIFDR